MIIYNLFLFLSLRDRSYLYYIIFIASFLMYLMIKDGLAYQWLWPNAVNFNKSGIPFFMALSILWGSLFTKAYLSIRWKDRSVKWMYALILGVLGLAVAGIAASFLTTSALPLVTLSGLVFAVVMFACGLAALFRHQKGSSFFVIAWFAYMLAIVVSASSNFGLILPGFFTEYGMHFGLVGLVVFLSFALADRINHITREKNETKTENARIRSMNERLHALDRAKTNYFANVSHELKTPVALIQAPLEALRQGEYGESVPRGSQVFALMQRNLDRLSRLTLQMLDTARLEAGGLGRALADGYRVQGALPGAGSARSRRPGHPGQSRGLRVGDVQPAVQRPQVHPRPRPDHRVLGGRRGDGRHPGERHRHRHRRGRPGKDFPPLPAHLRKPAQRLRGNRDRPVDLPRDRPRAWRRAGLREHGRNGQLFQPDPAAGAGSGHGRSGPAGPGGPPHPAG
jgi:signal transduction histidine kinase